MFRAALDTLSTRRGPSTPAGDPPTPPANDKDVWWAGLDDRGAALPSGSDVVRLSGLGRAETARVALLR